MRHPLLTLLAVFGLAIPIPASLADAEGERAALAQLAHELDALAPLINKAEAQANPDARIRFQYRWLQDDLAQMKAGVLAHIKAPRTQPRTFPPLKGDYRQ